MGVESLDPCIKGCKSAAQERLRRAWCGSPEAPVAAACSSVAGRACDPNGHRAGQPPREKSANAGSSSSHP